MREILFRGKTKDGEWRCGGVLQNEGYSAIIEYSDYHHWHKFVEVIPETVSEFTSLTDKNGKKIFEGDIVEYKEEYGEIAYDNEQAMFSVLFDTWCTDFDHIYSYELEVIGNIHDNPELLKGE